MLITKHITLHSWVSLEEHDHEGHDHANETNEDHDHEGHDHDEHNILEAEDKISNPAGCNSGTSVSIYHLEAGEYVLEFESTDNSDFNLAVLLMPEHITTIITDSFNGQEPSMLVALHILDHG